MKDKKIYLLILLIFIWGFSHLRGNRKRDPSPEISRRAPRRPGRSKDPSLPQLDYHKFQARREVTASGRDLFNPPAPKRVAAAKPVISEETLIKRELDGIDFLGMIDSPMSRRIYLEYRNEIYDIAEGEEMNISTANASYPIDIIIEDEYITYIEETHSLRKKTNI